MKKRILSVITAITMAIACFAAPIEDSGIGFGVVTAGAETTYPTPTGYDDNDYQKLVEFARQGNNMVLLEGGINWLDSFLDNPASWKWVTWIESGGSKRVSRISIFDKNLSGVLDLSDFTALTNLECGRNKLTKLNVSNNTALTELRCYENYLTDLDLSNNTALENLLCYENQLTDLDLSNNTALTTLSCSNNPLMKLDISNNTALEFLDCYNNQLTELDLSNNTALVDLICSNNQLTELDVSNNTELGTLVCADNKLTNLDVTNNTALSHLECYNNQLTEIDVSKNTELKSLSCNGNQLTNLDVSKNTQLTGLGCYNNQLTALDVSKNTALTSLYCGSIQLTELDVSKNTELTSLGCENNQLTELDVSKNTALTSFSCQGNRLTTLDVSNNLALRSLSCNFNQLTTLDVSNNTELMWLLCDNNKLTKLDVAKNTELMWLLCDNNKLTNLDLSKNIKLRELNCSCNLLTDILSSLDELPDLGKLGYSAFYERPINGQVDISNNYLDLDSAAIMASINKVKATVEANGGEFFYEPQRGTSHHTDVYSFQLSPSYISVKRGDAAKFTVTATPSGSLGTVTWKLDGKEISGTGASIDIPTSAAGSYAVSAEIAVGGKTYKAFAELRVYEETANPTYTLSDTKVTLNLAAKTGALLRYSTDGAELTKSDKIELWTNYGKKNSSLLSAFKAEAIDGRTIEITANGSAKTASSVTAVINGVPAAGAVGITVTTKYPKITFAADSLDLYYKNRSVIKAFADDGTEVKIEKIEVLSSPTAVEFKDGGLRLTGSENKTGTAKLEVTLSSPDYKNLSKTGNKFSAAVKIVNTDPKLKAPTKAGTLTTKGKIDISDPNSAVFAAVKEKIDTVGLDSEYFTAVRISDQLFKIKVKDGARPVPGVKYNITVNINGKPITKPLSITPAQTASKAVQSKKEITLYKDAAKIGEEITLDLTTPANVKLGEVKIQDGNFELVRAGQNSWYIRFKGGEVPPAAKASYTVKLELWAEGAYTLDNSGKPTALVSGAKKSKPTIVSVKVNVR